MRIVSLLPSATEIICALGLREQLVGVTHECDFPPGVETLPHVTRTRIPHHASSAEIDQLVRAQLASSDALYSLDMPVLESLRPDLIVTQALCDVCAVAAGEVRAAACALPGAPQVVNLEPTCLDEVFECIAAVGSAAHCEDRAQHLLAALRRRVDAVVAQTAALSDRLSVVLLEWIDPPFCSGHWSPELIHLAGAREVLGEAGKPSHTLTWDAVRAADPDVLFVACCGFDLARSARDLPLLADLPGYAELRAVSHDAVYVVDGNAYFSRPGPRLVDSLEIMAATLHPRLFAQAAAPGKALRVSHLLAGATGARTQQAARHA